MIYIGVLHLNQEIRYYIILRGSAGTPKCITNVDVMHNHIKFKLLMVRSNYCSFTFNLAVFTAVLVSTQPKVLAGGVRKTRDTSIKITPINIENLIVYESCSTFKVNSLTFL